MASGATPHFQNTMGLSAIEVGAREFMCIGAKPPFYEKWWNEVRRFLRGGNGRQGGDQGSEQWRQNGQRFEGLHLRYLPHADSTT